MHYWLTADYSLFPVPYSLFPIFERFDDLVQA